MKKYDLLKTIGITLLIVALISWVVPAGSYVNGEFTSLGSIVSVGIYDLLRLPVSSIATFIQYGLLMLAIGGFYGVLNKTLVYSKLVNAIVKKYEKKQKSFLILTIALLSIMVSIIGLPNIMFILVPFFVAVLIKLGYSKMTSFAATVGSILFGQIGSTFAFSTWGFLKYVFKVDMTGLLFARIILLAMIIVLFTLFINKRNDENKKAKKKDETIPLYEENNSKKSFIPLVVLFAITFVILAIGMYNWRYAFGVSTFSKLQEVISSVKIGDNSIIANILGGTSEIGFFTNYDVISILIISSLIIGWVYSVSFEEIISGFVDGMKKMVKPAVYSVLSCTIFAALLNMANTASADFVYTIINKFYDADKFNLIGTAGGTAIASFAYNDFYTLANNLHNVFGSNAENVNILAFITQTISGIVMVIAPTSIYLMAGLSYLEISYKEWAKYIFKILLVVTGVVVLIGFILSVI